MRYERSAIVPTDPRKGIDGSRHRARAGAGVDLRCAGTRCRRQFDCLRGSRCHPHRADLRRTVDHDDSLRHCHYARWPNLAPGVGIQRAPLAGRNALLLFRGSRDAVGILRLARAGAGGRPGESASPEPQLHFAGCHLSRRQQPMAGQRSCCRCGDRGGDVDVHRPYDPRGVRNGGTGTATRRSGSRRARTCRRPAPG